MKSVSRGGFRRDYTRVGIGATIRFSAAGAAAANDKHWFELPIPILIVLYHGSEDWVEKEIWFQDLFKDIPPALRDLVPRFKVLVINLRRFQYRQLPGRPLTRVFVEWSREQTMRIEPNEITVRELVDGYVDDEQTGSVKTPEYRLERIKNCSGVFIVTPAQAGA